MKTKDKKESENECQKMIFFEKKIILQDLNKQGIKIKDIFDLDEFGHELRSSDEKQAIALPLLLYHMEEKYHASVKDGIYTMIACADWLKGKLLIKVIDTLVKQFENDNMLFTHCYIDGAFEAILARNKDYEGVKSWDEISTIDVRWTIGLALEGLINHKLVSHKKYQEKLRIIINNKKYRKGRSELVTAYAKLAKQEAIPDLIDLLDGWDIDVLGATIVALGRLKSKEAKPHLEKLLKHEDPYFRDLARKALRKIA